MTPAPRALALLSILITAACADKTDTRRWYSMQPGAAADDAVQVAVYEAPRSSEAPANPFSVFSDQAHAAYVKGMADRTKTADAFRTEVSAPLTPPPAVRAGQPVSDRTPRMLVATLTRPGEYRPGDRIMRAVMHVRPLNFTFGGYTIAQTDRQTVDVTTVQRTSTAGASLTLSPAPAAVASPLGGSLGLTASRGLNTTTKLQENPETLTVDIRPSCLRVVREGAHSADLTGNTRINLTTLAETAPSSIPCGTRGGDPRLDATHARPQAFWVVGPDLRFVGGQPAVGPSATPGNLQTYPTRPLLAQVVLDFVLRRIKSGEEYYDEGEQTVELLSGRNTSCQTVVGVERLLPPLFVLVRANQPGGRAGETVNVRGLDVADETILAFSDFETARAAERWVNRAANQSAYRARALHLGALRLTVDGQARYHADRYRPPRPPACSQSEAASP